MFSKGIVSLVLVVSWSISCAHEYKASPTADQFLNTKTFLRSTFFATSSYLKPDTLRSDTLKAVEIIKERDLIPLSVTQSVQQLTGKQLENSNSLNVADALKGFNGVQIRDYGGIGGMKTIDVRSLGSKHTAVFYDGIAINDAQSGEIDLSKFSIDNLQSISLYQNNHQDIAQPAKAFASASVLYLQSKAPVFKEGKNTNFSTKLNGGSFGLINPSIGIQQKIAANTSLSFNTEWLKANGEYDFHYKNQALLDTIIRRRNTDIETFKVEGVFQGMLADSSLWRLNGYAYFSERGLPGPAVNNKYYTQDRQWDKNLFLQGHWDKKFSEVYQLKLNGKYTYNWLRYVDPLYNERFELNNLYKQQEAYFSAINVFQITNRLKTAISADYIYNTLDANLLQFAYPTRNTGLLNLAIDYRIARLQLQGNLLATSVIERVKAGNNALTKTAYSPSFSASYQVLEEPLFYVRASYKSIFRMPTFNDSYYTFAGSTHLKPEYVKALNIGLTLEKEYAGFFNKVTFKADAYRNQIKDKITAIPKSFRWTMVNLGEVEIMGLDLGLQGNWTFSEGVYADLSVNGTIQKALDNKVGSNEYGHDIPYSPRQSGSLNANIHYAAWTFSSSSQYIGGRYSLFYNLPTNYMEPFFLQDIGLSYLWNWNDHSIRLKADINNLINTDYVILENYPMPGRNFRLGIYARF